MVGGGSPQGPIDAAGLSVAVIGASWHDIVMAGLIDAALESVATCGAESRLYRVPGSFELPVAARAAAGSGYDAVVALGVIIRGGTPHFEFVAAGVTQGLTTVAVEMGVPVGFGVLTCDTEEQALDRAGLPGSAESKGREAAEAALATAVTLRSIAAPKRPYPGFGSS